MHTEIQIKDNWWPNIWLPKTRNERFVWENEQYLYRFLPRGKKRYKYCSFSHTNRSFYQEVKKRYKYCSFSHTNRSFRVLGHQCVVTMGNCLIWISLCMFFFPLIETVTYTCHYMTDRLERFDLKTSKLDLLKKKRHLHLGCPWGKLIDTKF